MSYEETLICDGCCSVVDGGPRRFTLQALKDGGGRAFGIGMRPHTWLEVESDNWLNAKLHLCGDCVRDGRPTFFNSDPIPTPKGQDHD